MSIIIDNPVGIVELIHQATFDCMGNILEVNLDEIGTILQTGRYIANGILDPCFNATKILRANATLFFDWATMLWG